MTETETDERRHEYGLCESCWQPVRLDKYGRCRAHKAKHLWSPWMVATVSCGGAGRNPRPWVNEE